MFNPALFNEADASARAHEEQARQMLWERLTEKADLDPAFRRDLAKDPVRVVQQEAEGLGITKRPEVVKDVAEKASAKYSHYLPEVDPKRVEDLIFGTIEDIRRSFNLTLLLSQVLFYSGLVMVLVAFVTGILGGDKLLAAVLGAGGILSSLLSTTVISPLNRLRDAAGNLVQFQMAYLAYYKQLYLLGGETHRLTHQELLDYTREVGDRATALMASVRLSMEVSRRPESEVAGPPRSPSGKSHSLSPAKQRGKHGPNKEKESGDVPKPSPGSSESPRPMEESRAEDDGA